MSWFETTNFASIAKNALKEAQKTIDKALDIKEQERSALEHSVNHQIKDTLKKETHNFFTSFGLSEEDAFSKVKGPAADGNLAIHTGDDGHGGMVGSLWGSFAGSFFENSKDASQKDFSKSSSAPESPSGSIIETQPPRVCCDLPELTSGSVVGSNSSSSIMQLSTDAITPIQEDPLTTPEFADGTFSLGKTSLTQDHLSSKSRGWGWDAWESNTSSIMVMTSDLQLEGNDSSIEAEDPHEESLADDSLDHDGFASSRLVVRSVESDKTLRHESFGSLASTKSQAEVDPLQIVNEEVFCDPFEEEDESPIMQIILTDVQSKLDDSSSFSLPFNTPNSPDSIITLPSSEISPMEDIDFGIPKLEHFPSNNDVPSLPNVSSSDSVELINSNGIATSSSIEVLSTPSTNESPPLGKDCQNTEDISNLGATPVESAPSTTSLRNPDKEHDIPAITKQPIASILPQAFSRSTSDYNSPSNQECERAFISSHLDGIGGSTFFEDSSTCDSIHSASTSSTLTALDTSISGQDTLVSSFPESPTKLYENLSDGSLSMDVSSTAKVSEKKELDRLELELLSSKSSTTNDEHPSNENVSCPIDKEMSGSSLPMTVISKSREDSSTQGDLPIGLESSTRSESSTETVTTSVDSQNIWTESISFDGDLIQSEDLTSKGLTLEAEVQDLIQEAMAEEKTSDLSHDNERKPDTADIRTVASQERERSPSSSEKSDVLKMSSGHSSADEVETATSSDIEVISSPSIDGSNGNSRGYGPPPSIASKIWSSSQRGLKANINEAADSSTSNSSGRRDNGNNGFHDRGETVPSSMTTSITSISESEGEGFLLPTAELLQMENSRISQALLKEFTTYEKGHRRNQSNISETSESSSELQSPEIDKLLKKLTLLSEVLQARETKLIEMSHANASMQETNHSLNLRLEELEASKRGVDATEAVRDEFTQRLVAMERKFQQALREKEAAKKQLEECKVEAASMLSSAEIFRELEEKETVIKELREEGDKLSRQERQHLNIIKKLRTKEKETDACIKTQKEKIECQCHEVERLQKQLSAKEEVERSQIDAIRRLTIANERQDKEIKELAASTDESEGKCSTLKDALDATYREIGELKRLAAAHDAEAQELALSAEVAARQKAELTLTESQGQNMRNQEALIAQIHELQDSIGRAEVQSNRKERQLKADIGDLQTRLADSESRCNDLSNAVSTATRPLLRQMDNLQSSYTARQLTWESLEESLTKRLNDTQNAAAISTEKERNAKQQHMAVLSELTNLQAQISSFKAENSEQKSKNQELSSRASHLEEAKIRDLSKLGALKASFAEEIGEVKHERDLLEQQLDIERTALSAEKKKNQNLQEQNKEKDRRFVHQQQLISQHSSVEDTNRITPRSSPTPSLSRISVSGSVSESFMGSQWGDDVFDPAWPSSRSGTLYDTLRANSAATVEVLTSTLRQREGELHHVQSELIRHEAQKESLALELVDMSGKVQKLESLLEEQEELQKKLVELEQRYNALLQMHGEKVEEVEELRLDLVDVKEMYKAQIDHLLKK